ncbi:Zn-ribbon domain-containing OB-fold protein [Streptomyces qinglanensis]|uniref:Zn-ribbon domain-containing OB-fold protein n=1 Tax=Streptomyces qinglanensis TaxID=943816 RepID=UPI003D70B85B
MSGPAAQQRFDLPDIDAFTAPYWQAAAEGRLLVRRCRAEGCGAAHHYPREFCPHCWSADVDWEEADGRATLYTWSVVHRNDLPPFTARVPYTAAVVELAEGPRMMTEVTDCPPEALRTGMALRVAFRPVEAAPTAPTAATAPGDGGAQGAKDAKGPAGGEADRPLLVPVFRPVGE